jgi:hypothetical protein
MNCPVVLSLIYGNCEYVSVTSQSMEMKAGKNEGNNLDYSCGPNLITWTLKIGGRGKQEELRREMPCCVIGRLKRDSRCEI